LVCEEGRPGAALAAEDAVLAMALLREAIAEIKADVKHLATKSDVSEAKATLVMWIVGTMIAAGALAFAIARFASAPAAPQQPQIIVVPTLVGDISAPAFIADEVTAGNLSVLGDQKAQGARFDGSSADSKPGQKLMERVKPFNAHGGKV
jgi:hypothetical protein